VICILNFNQYDVTSSRGCNSGTGCNYRQRKRRVNRVRKRRSKSWEGDGGSLCLVNWRQDSALMMYNHQRVLPRFLHLSFCPYLFLVISLFLALQSFFCRKPLTLWKKYSKSCDQSQGQF